MNDAKRIEKDLLAELKARGVALTDLKKRQVREVACDMALVERLRDQINQGAALDLDAFMKLKASAAASKAELLGSIPDRVVNKIEVELVPSRRPEALAALEAKNAELQAKLAVLEKAATSAASPAVPPNMPDAPPPSPPAAPSAPPTNVVPIETREQRIARLRYAAGDRRQSLRPAVDGGLGCDFGLSGGATRFDNKVPLP